MTSDLAWLKGHAFLMCVGPGTTPGDVPAAVAGARDAGLGGIVLSPSHLELAGDTGGLTVAVVVGFPTGRHHSLVKAAEARLAVQQGAAEVWLTPDPGVAEMNTLLAEFVAVREAVPHPVTLAVILETPARTPADVAAVAEAARLAGVDRLVTATGWLGEAPGASASMPLPLTVTGVRDLDGVIAALDSGADRVGVSSVSAVGQPPR
ncbi:2-deoxyribose-5-phosphate aldolase [Corynebacterium comes]|uniref:Deoxyribose-phosphate aldolase n=1 Tax=Corynebacterium comes TaxID=2675218 RepID=A0A6B8VUC9_9CORY|nr:2-deoxyribose-5-phosphate aldolase [Corynebacterium comes]QGU03641.1 Deoxyribose-phosphate aldolase [Corynebacterium comes]